MQSNRAKELSLEEQQAVVWDLKIKLRDMEKEEILEKKWDDEEDPSRYIKHLSEVIDTLKTALLNEEVSRCFEESDINKFNDFIGFAEQKLKHEINQQKKKTNQNELPSVSDKPFVSFPSPRARSSSPKANQPNDLTPAAQLSPGSKMR